MFNDSRCWLAAHTLFGTLCISTSVLAVELTPDLQLHGYATVGLSQLSHNQGTTYPNPYLTGAPVIESRISGKYDSIAGLQLNYQVNDQISMATQMYVAAHGVDNTSYAPKFNWAYIDYRFNDEWALRSGRFSFSPYLYAEKLHVGEAHPWAHLPPVIYGNLGGFYSLNGAQLLYKHAFDDWLLRVEPGYGKEGLNGYKVKNLKQLQVSLSNDDLTLHLGSGLGDVNVDPSLLAVVEGAIDATLAGSGASAADIALYNASLQASVKQNKVRAEFSDVGFIYDDGRWFAAGELAGLRFSGYIRDYNAGYVSVGHHFGKWLPYVIYSQYKEVNLAEFDEIPAPGNEIIRKLVKLDEHTISVGTRYQLRDNACLKFQADRVSGFKGNFRSGLFVPPAGSETIPSTLKSAYIFSASLSVAF